jgi:hypothetical protein
MLAVAQFDTAGAVVRSYCAEVSAILTESDIVGLVPVADGAWVVVNVAAAYDIGAGTQTPAGADVLIVKYNIGAGTVAGSLRLSTADADVAYSARAAPTALQMVFTMTTTAPALPYVGYNSGDAGSVGLDGFVIEVTMVGAVVTYVRHAVLHSTGNVDVVPLGVAVCAGCATGGVDAYVVSASMAAAGAVAVGGVLGTMYGGTFIVRYVASTMGPDAVRSLSGVGSTKAVVVADGVGGVCVCAYTTTATAFPYEEGFDSSGGRCPPTAFPLQSSMHRDSYLLASSESDTSSPLSSSASSCRSSSLNLDDATSPDEAGPAGSRRRLLVGHVVLLTATLGRVSAPFRRYCLVR